MTVTLPEGDEKVRAVRAMFDAIAPRYDLVNRIMTFGLDVRWRRRAVRSLDAGPGATVVDQTPEEGVSVGAIEETPSVQQNEQES